MSHYSEGQVHLLADSLEAHGFTPEQLTALGQNRDGALDNLKLYLLGLATIVCACFRLALNKALDLSSFIGGDWKFWRGPADGTGLEGDEDYIFEPDVIDFKQVVLETHLQEKETSIHGEEKMKRARGESKNHQLGDKTFLALWNDWLAKKAEGKPEDSILERLRRSGKIGAVIYFFGRTLWRPGDLRYVLCLSRGGCDQWSWFYGWLGSSWYADSPSVALASVKTQS
ncbi:MAG: hypothetical protein AAB509_02105 [Patescibacteria group bacterium]